MGKHHAPENIDSGGRVSRVEVRNIVLAMAALTVFVIAMVASYSGAFAKPALHHLNVAVAGPQQFLDGVRGQDALSVTEVSDADEARQRVYDRRADAALAVGQTGDVKIYVAGGGGRSVANAAETVGRGIATKAGLTPSVEDIAPTSQADPQGTVEFLSLIHI